MRPNPGPFRSDWLLHKRLLEARDNLLPEAIGGLTLGDIDLILSDPKGRCPDGSDSMSAPQMEAEMKHWQELTPLERLREFKR